MIVAIDIETGEYEVADNSMAAAETLLKRCPDAQGHYAIFKNKDNDLLSLSLAMPPAKL
jgi:hypothetical protein